MAQAAVAPGLDLTAGVGAHQETLSKLEALVEEIDAALARRKSNGHLRRAIKAFRRGKIVRAGQLALSATEVDDTNAQAFHVLAMALERMGHLHKALVTYERSFQLDPNDPELLLNLGLTAWNQGLTAGAEKMFQLYIQACPESPLGYNNLGSVQSDLGNPDTAIETLRAAIYRMPMESILWNSLATVLAEEGRVDESLAFYEEAVRLAPDFARPYHNLGYAYSHLGRLGDALEAYENSLARSVDEAEQRESRHSRSVCLIGMGRLEEGFREYEIRNTERFRAYVHHMTNAPLWKGEPLTGKRILIVGEQGLGDEFMFANILPDLTNAVGETGKVQIAVDPRLVPLFQRSYPNAQVGAYDDRKLLDPDGAKELRFIPWAMENGEPDFYAPMGTALQFYRKRVEDFPKVAFLTPDPARVTEFRKRLEALGSGPLVGVCWRSMMLGAKRSKYYSPLDTWGPILKTPGVTFVNLQYGDCKDELARASTLHGVNIHVFDDLDLKNDIDGAAALSATLDLVVSAPTAAAATAASVGAEVWFLTAGRTWPQLGTDHYPWYRATKVLSPETFGDWKALMPRVGEKLREFALHTAN
ncbi:MAG: tetratricopeptide repeat protein [Proteobacteria bacterium]|nr:tetratricopeptide repeat protein [Pseudomonadota bacterium]